MKLFRHIYCQFIIILFVGILSCSCNKQNDWLNVKSSKASVVPETVKDFQAIMDNTTTMTRIYSNAGLVGADNLYINDADFSSQGEAERNLYSWNKEVWPGGLSYDWNSYFSMVEYANIVIDGLAKINPNNNGYNNVKGQAFFYRSMAYYELAQLFCKPYNSATANSDLGLPIRLTSDVNVIVKERSTLKELYDQIISDGLMAESLLDANQTYLLRPSNLAADALMAKAYLVMNDYTNALKYADKVLIAKPVLLDFNNSSVVSLSNEYRFLAYGKDNPEILYYGEGNMYNSPVCFLGNIGYVPSELYGSYNDNDLRKSFYFGSNANGINYVGGYTGSFTVFCGLATNQIYLIHAECEARLGNKDAALKDLNQLLKNRYKTGTFTDLTAANADDALQTILVERRKELPDVGNVRWEDLRRLNTDPRFRVTLKRTINHVEVELPPNDARYVLPIPDQEIQISGLEQNPR